MPFLTDDPFLWLTEAAQMAIDAALKRSLEAAEAELAKAKLEAKAAEKKPKKRVAFLEPLPTVKTPVTPVMPVTPPVPPPTPELGASAAAGGGAAEWWRAEPPKLSLSIRVPKIDTVFCPDCSHEVLDEAQYCDGCEECLWCDDCGSMRESGDRFCAPCRYEWDADRDWRCGY